MLSGPLSAEFIFRDAKQFVGLDEGQARDWIKIDFHINVAMTVVSLARVAHYLNTAISSVLGLPALLALVHLNRRGRQTGGRTLSYLIRAQLLLAVATFFLIFLLVGELDDISLDAAMIYPWVGTLCLAGFYWAGGRDRIWESDQWV